MQRKPNSRWLQCYSTGDGALSLYWSNGSGEAAPARLGEIKRYFARSPNTAHLRDNGYGVYVIGGEPRLVRRVKRLSPNLLRFVAEKTCENKAFTYTVDRDGPDFKPGHHAAGDVTFTFSVNRAETGREEMTLVNEGMKACLIFFLNHEKELTEQDQAASK